PPYSRVILDEAHHVEDVATEYFAAKVSRIAIMRLLARLASDKQGHLGKLFVLKKRIAELRAQQQPPNTQLESIVRRLGIDLPASRHALLDTVARTFDAIEVFYQANSQQASKADDSPMKEEKLRLQQHHFTHPNWGDLVQKHVKELRSAIGSYVAGIH